MPHKKSNPRRTPRRRVVAPQPVGSPRRVNRSRTIRVSTVTPRRRSK